jgi:hypothetical protein
MSIRKRNDAQGYRRGAIGIDMDKDGKFTKTGLTAPDSMTYTYENGPERSYDPLAKRRPGDAGAEVGMDQTLGRRNVRDTQWRWETRDIWSDVNENDGPRDGASAAIRAGVNRSQGSNS